jgi:hypothetical protein
MGKLALTVVGMGIGFAIGGPFGAQIGAMVGGMVGNILFAPTVKGPRLTDLTVTASTYGQVIAELYGTMRLGGNMIWTSGIKEKKHKSGGKGGPKQITYSYSASFAIAFCKGEVNGVNRLWADGKLIAGSDPAKEPGPGTPLSLAGVLNLTKKSKGKFHYRFYTGTEEQMPDSTIVAKEGEGKVPGYRGIAYIVFVDMPLEDFGNRIPQITAEITHNPVPIAPYVQLTSDTTAGPPITSFPDGTVDFINDKYTKMSYINRGDGVFEPWFIHYDMRTMQELYRVGPIQKTYTVLDMFGDATIDWPEATNWPAFNPAFSIGGNYFFANCSLHNSGTACIWDATTGEQFGRLGHESNGFPADPLPDSSRPFNPKAALIGTWDARALWFRTLNGTGQDDLIYHCGNLGSRAIIWNVGYQPVHWLDFGGGSFGGAATWQPMRGAERAPTETGLGSSDMLFLKSVFNGTDWDIRLKTVTITDGAVMIQAGGPPYVMTNHPANTETEYFIPRPFAGEDLIMSNGAYDASDNSIVLWARTGANNFGNGGTWRFVKYLIDEGTYAWAHKDTDLDPSFAVGGYDVGTSVGSPFAPAYNSNLDGGTLGWMRPTMLGTYPAIYVADLSTGNIKFGGLRSPFNNFVEGGWHENAWDDQTQSIMAAQPRIFIRSPGDGVSLQGIVDDVLVKTGTLTPGADWDSTALADITVHGYVISREASARDILQQLAGAYFFDGVESDYIIKCVLRGQAPIVNLTQKHLGFVGDRDISIRETRQQEIELPMRVSVTYSDTSRDYQDGTQSAKRNTNPFPTMHSHNEVKIELPIALSASEAKQIADKSLKMSWAQRLTYKMKLPWEFLKYDPTDVITVTMDTGTIYTMRLDKIDMGVDFNLDVDGVSEKATAYISAVVGDPGSGVPTPVLNVGGPCDLFILNTPLLRDIDDTQGNGSVYYVTAKSVSPGDFIACYVFEATDSTLTEYEDIDVISTEPTWGTATTALPDHYNYGIDTTTTLTVRMMSVDADYNYDVLESITWDELLAGKNAAIVGDEIIQFQTATVRADGRTYDLSGILRARRGTNTKTKGHKAGERFVMLELDGSIKRERNATSEWDTTHSFKAVPTGSYSETSLATSVDMQPNDLKPYTPEQVRITDDGTDITVTFERRSRIGNEMNSGGTPTSFYNEGQGSLAHFVYKVWGNKLLTDTPWDPEVTPDFTGTVAIYSGVTLVDPLTFSFDHTGMSSFVIELHEVGYVNGFSKYVQFEKVSSATPFPLTLTNPGAETGDVTGWTTRSGGNPQASMAETAVLPHSGSWFLVATYSGATAKWDQQVAIDPSHYADIDAGLCSASGSAYHNSYAGETDSGALYVEAIANDGTTILDRIENSQSHPTVWTQEAAALALPSGTRYLRIGTNNVRSWGTHLESHWDDFTLSLFVSGVTLGSTEWNQTELY